MAFSIDPKQTDVSLTDALEALPSQAAVDRVVRASAIESSIAEGEDIAHHVAELSPNERRTLVTQIRWGGTPTVYYFVLDGLRDARLDGIESTTDSTHRAVYGPQIERVVDVDTRTYLICSTPPGGTQTQLVRSDAPRSTAVAAITPESDVLSIRADSESVARAAASEVCSRLDVSWENTVDFHRDGFRQRFSRNGIKKYTALTLVPNAPATSTERIEVTGEDGRDLRGNPIVAELRELDVALAAASGLLQIWPSPRTTIDFTTNSIAIEQFVPEQTWANLDQAVIDCVEV